MIGTLLPAVPGPNVPGTGIGYVNAYGLAALVRITGPFTSLTIGGATVTGSLQLVLPGEMITIVFPSTAPSWQWFLLT